MNDKLRDKGKKGDMKGIVLNMRNQDVPLEDRENVTKDHAFIQHTEYD